MKEVLARLYNQECTESGSPGGKPENWMSVADPCSWSDDGK